MQALEKLASEFSIAFNKICHVTSTNCLRAFATRFIPSLSIFFYFYGKGFYLKCLLAFCYLKLMFKTRSKSRKELDVGKTDKNY